MKILTFILSLFGLVASADDLPRISPAQAQQEVSQKKSLLLDVRERDEVQDGMAAPAQWLAKSVVDSGGAAFLDFLKKNPAPAKVIVYCRSGKRSEAVGKVLRGKGYEVKNMGGFSDWTAASLPVRQGP